MNFVPVAPFLYDKNDGCDCRKPKPGAIIAAAKRRNIDLSLSYMVGDRWLDIDAGQQAGCKTIFIDYKYDEKQPVSFDHRASSLLELSGIILREINEKN